MALSGPWQQFYREAQQQSVIDPRLVVAIARSETGDQAANAGLFTLGIDVRGSGGSGGSVKTISNATHTFYAYSSGLQAANGLATFLQQNPRYGSDVGTLFHDPPSLLQRLVLRGYSGCPGPECDPIWDRKILNIASTLGPPANGDVTPLVRSVVSGEGVAGLQLNPPAQSQAQGQIQLPGQIQVQNPIEAVANAIGGGFGQLGTSIHDAIATFVLSLLHVILGIFFLVMILLGLYLLLAN
jgi:hypothetical protein